MFLCLLLSRKQSTALGGANIMLNKSTENLLVAINELLTNKACTIPRLRDKETYSATYGTLFDKCKDAVATLSVNDDDNMIALFKAAILPDVYNLAYFETVGVWSDDQINAVVNNIEGIIYNYARKGAFNNISYDLRWHIYNVDFGWSITRAGFPKR